MDEDKRYTQASCPGDADRILPIPVQKPYNRGKLVHVFHGGGYKYRPILVNVEETVMQGCNGFIECIDEVLFT